jgi:hypothetical protein
VTLQFFRRGLVVVSAAALATATVTAAQATSPPGWRVQKNVVVAGKYVQMDAVTADAPGDAWALGTVQPETSTTLTPLAYHWTGRGWQHITLPSAVIKSAKTDPDRYVIGASSSTNVWAFMSAGHWVRWNGKTWTVGTFPSPGAGTSGPQITSVSVFSRTDVWAFGSYATSEQTQAPYAAHFDGTSWTASSPPGNGGISAASAVSSTDIWAVIGDATHGSTATQAVLHWTGSAWQSVALPSALATGSELSSITAASDTDVWVGGVQSSSGDGVAAQWNGESWSVDTFRALKNFSIDELVDMVPDGNGGIWALASCTLGPCWRLWHYTGGVWAGPTLPKIAGDPMFVNELAYVPGTTSVWGSGGRSLTSTTQQGMIIIHGKLPT